MVIIPLWLRSEPTTLIHTFRSTHNGEKQMTNRMRGVRQVLFNGFVLLLERNYIYGQGEKERVLAGQRFAVHCANIR